MDARARDIRQKLLAVLEVVLIFTLFRVILVPWVLPLIMKAGMLYQVLVYGFMFLLPILVILVRRESPAAYGISLRNFKYHAHIALDAFIPVAVTDTLIGWLIPLLLPLAVTRWEGALLYSLFNVILLFVLGMILGRKPGPAVSATFALLPLLISTASTNGGAAQILPFFYYLLLVGPGEEIFFRGYVQSRLNQVFGCPYRFYGASWGWGAILASLLFGAMHIFNGYNPLTGSISFSWAWGAWTVFSGLVFAYLREKTGSVVAPAILHGLPQAIASLFLGVFAVS